MLKTAEGYVAATMLAVLFCPALFGLGIALAKAKLGIVDSAQESFRSGMGIHAMNALLSPCIPACLLYLDSRSGGGSMASLLALPILPMTWVLFFVGNKRVRRAKAIQK